MCSPAPGNHLQPAHTLGKVQQPRLQHCGPQPIEVHKLKGQLALAARNIKHTGAGAVGPRGGMGGGVQAGRQLNGSSPSPWAWRRRQQ